MLRKPRNVPPMETWTPAHIPAFSSHHQIDTCIFLMVNGLLKYPFLPNQKRCRLVRWICVESISILVAIQASTLRIIKQRLNLSNAGDIVIIIIQLYNITTCFLCKYMRKILIRKRLFTSVSLIKFHYVITLYNQNKRVMLSCTWHTFFFIKRPGDRG